MSQCELGIETMKKSNFEIVYKAHDTVGFFSHFHVSRVTQKY